MLVNNLPRLTNALREFGSFSTEYSSKPNQVSCRISLEWIDLQVILRESSPHHLQTIKSCSSKLLQFVEDISKCVLINFDDVIRFDSSTVGSEEDAEVKKSIASSLFAEIYSNDVITTNDTKRINDKLLKISKSQLQSIFEIVKKLTSLNDVITEKVDNIVKRPVTIFGQKIKFCSERRTLEYEEEENDFEEDEEVGDTSEALISLMQNMKHRETDNDVTNHQNMVTDGCCGYQWLVKSINKKFGSEDLIDPCVELLSSEFSDENLQEKLCELLGFEQFEMILKILQNRSHIVEDNRVWKAREELKKIESQNSGGGARSLQTAFNTTAEKEAEKNRRKVTKKLRKVVKGQISNNQRELDPKMLRQKRNEALTNALKQVESRVTSSSKVQMFPNVFDRRLETRQKAECLVAGFKMALPEGFQRIVTKDHEEIKLPASKQVERDVWDLVPISSLDHIAQRAFSGVKRLNIIQSKVFPTAYHTNENMLVCAPTGAGKTNVAMLTIVREVMQNVEAGVIQKDKFKIVYVAPMKALASEMTTNFSKRLSPLGVVVRELTGDTQLTKNEIANTQMLVVTPEKWDVVTRKSTGDVTLARLVRLLIIDEVHLLHDDRGSVIETIVARTLRQVEQQQSMIRIVGLSATLPNYMDVSNFLRVNPFNGLFFFDGRFRPVPLEQNFIGVKGLSIVAQRRQMDQACYDVVIKNLKNNQQVLVFVHARNATVVAAKSLYQLAGESNQSNYFDCLQMEGYSDALKQVTRSRNQTLHDLFRHGVGVHHAGLARSDRFLMEKMFAQGYIRVLCTTATLAWGINLPAHAVVIKGTQYYDAKKGGFVDVGVLDVLQIFGRAGRPQFDTTGEGTIITTNDKFPRYIRLMTQQTPIESQFVGGLIDNMNAEISLGTVATIDDAVKWISYTYLFVRIKKNPLVYGIPIDVYKEDPGLVKWQIDLCKSAARQLDRLKMIRFDERNGYFHPTDLGRTASHYYINHESIELYNNSIHPTMAISKVISMICASSEFKQINVRDDELTELDSLVRTYCRNEKVIVENPEGKTNALFQTYISNGFVRSFSLGSDLNYISQNASRIVHAIFEIVLKRGMSRLASRLLELCKCVDRRSWTESSALRQFSPRLSGEVLRKIEERNLSIDDLRDYTAAEIGDVLRLPRIGSKVLSCVNEIPNVMLETQIQPITRTILRIKLIITPCFQWNNHVHGSSHESFWIWVEDPDTDHMYHSEYFQLHRKQVIKSDPQQVVFTIPLIEPHPSQYMVYVISDRWFASTAVCPISFHHLILPERHPPHTELLDLEPLPTSALQDDKLINIYNFTHFNPIQTQIFHCLFHNDTNCLIGAPTGSGKTVAAELALFRMLRTQPGSKAVYVAPLKALVRERMKDWQQRLSKQLGIKLVELTGDIAPDMRAVAASDVIITTPEKWDGVSRSWGTRDYVRSVSLLIIDEIHLLGQDRGPVLEVIVSRLSFISAQTNRPVRIVGLSTALANARDLADWLSIKQMGLFNFRPSVRPVPMETHIHGFAGKHYCPRMATMNKPAFQAIKTHSPTKPTLIFVSSRRQTRLTALDLIAFLAAEDDPKQWFHMDEQEMEEMSRFIKDPNLRFTLSFGIGLHHAGLVERDRSLVETLFANHKIQTLIATSTLAWGVNLPAHLVIVKGTEYYDGKNSRYQDFPITDVLQMMGRAGRPQYDEKAVAVILVHDVKKAFYKKFLYEPFPVESSLLEVLEDHLNAEIVAGTIGDLQEAVDYLTWTYFFRRLLLNPTYYNLIDTEHDSVNHFLSKLLHQAIVTLQQSGCVAMETDDAMGELVATNMGRIASFYYLSHHTMRMLEEQMSSEMTTQNVLELLTSSHEYEELPVRHNEDSVNSELAQQLPVPVLNTNYDLPSTKAHLLLHAHFSRTPLPSTDYVTDLKTVLDQAIRILQAFVDVSADRGWVVTSLRCMHLIQMVSQASWHHDNCLLTLPGLEPSDKDWLGKIKTPSGAPLTLAHLVEMSRDKSRGCDVIRRMLIAYLDEARVNKIINHVTSLPVIDVTLAIGVDGRRDDDVNISTTHGASVLREDTWMDVKAGSECVLKIRLQRLPNPNQQQRRDGTKALTPRFPKPKLEGCFLVLCDRQSRQLIAMKRVDTLRKYVNESLLFSAPEAPCKSLLTLMIVSDSYIGLDQLYDVRLRVR